MRLGEGRVVFPSHLAPGSCAADNREMKKALVPIRYQGFRVFRLPGGYYLLRAGNSTGPPGMVATPAFSAFATTMNPPMPQNRNATPAA